MGIWVQQDTGSRVDRIPTWILVALVLVVTLLKSGFATKSPVVWELENFPLPVSERGQTSSYGLRTLGYFFQTESQATYWLIAVAMTLLVMGLAVAALLASPIGSVTSRRLSVVVVLGGPLVWTVLREYHGLDPWVLAGSVIIASLSWGRIGFLVGLSLMLLGNPEQALVAMVALGIASLIPALRQWQPRAFIGLAVATIVVAAVSAVTYNLGGTSRLSMVRQYAIEGGGYFFSWGYLGLYAGLGLAPLFAIAIWLHSKRTITGIFMLGAFCVPVLFTMVTLDQSRVLVGTSSLLAVTVTLVSLPIVLDWLDQHNLDGPLVVLVTVLLLPVVHIEYPSVVRPGWLVFTEFLGSYV